MDTPDLCDFKGFAAVALRKNFRRAALDLGVSVSSLSTRMRALVSVTLSPLVLEEIDIQLTNCHVVTDAVLKSEEKLGRALGCGARHRSRCRRRGGFDAPVRRQL